MMNMQKLAITMAMTGICLPALGAQDAQRAAEEAARSQAAQQVEAESKAAQGATRSAQVAVDVRMQEAERRLAEAARQVAELSMAQLPRVERLERVIRASRGPMLGVSIGSDDESEPVAGVALLGVSPGGAADEGGLRAGDVITSVNAESLVAESSGEANGKLLDFMQGVENGDTLTVEYLRDGKSQSTEIVPRAMDQNVFAFDFDGHFEPDGQPFVIPDVHVAPGVRQFSSFIWQSDGDGFGAMELAPLSERLGSYFGTKDGLLVVSAPDNEDLQLQDGDVILNIDGRQPTSVAHAMRILGSYEGGESLEIEIMRDKRRRTVKLEIPDNRRSSAVPQVAPAPPAAPVKKVLVIKEDHT